jgi:starch phosphorylase
VEIPRTLERLYDLAYNMWWVWHPSARELWQRVSPTDWLRSPNPMSVLQQCTNETWEGLLGNDSFITLYDEVVGMFDDYMSQKSTWYSRTHPETLPNGVVYISTEFGVHHTLPFYSGGLGVLAGDTLKSASDLGLPMVGIGLLYRRGYFRQAIEPDGAQQHHYTPIEVGRRPARRVLDRTGHPLTIQVEFPGRDVDVAAWRIDVGRVPLLLLDTDVSSNDPSDRAITQILYVRGREMRLCQEIVLGVGGARLVDALGMTPSTWHINEGHAALALLERLARLVEEGESHEAAVDHVRSTSVFTLHTPVPAGNEVFDADLVDRYLAGRLPGISSAQLRALGDSGREGVFDMGALAIRLSCSTNGVSRRHGEVVTRDWQHIIGGPGTYVTNGVHMPTWVGGTMSRNFVEAVGGNWAEQLLEPEVWKTIRDLPDEAIWDAHMSQKERLLRHVRRALREQWARHGSSPGQLRTVEHALPPERLTMVFARRFAGYKRAGLLLTDLGRLEGLLTHPDRPIQLLFSGKAHPADKEGQAVIARVAEIARSHQFSGHIFFIEDYSMELARYLVGGADVWLNTPRPPMEASGTSGMKAAANGALNLSVLDGWWLEGFNGTNGWGCGEDHPSDDAAALHLYDIIEHEVAPLYYDQDDDGIPRAWVARMKDAIVSVVPNFSAQRMVAEYLTHLYLHANGA